MNKNKADTKESKNCHPSSKRRGRSRDEERHNAVLTATLEMLWEYGYKNLSIEKIAKHSKVTKVTIYKWWDSLPHLVLESLNNKFHNTGSIPDTGKIKDDITAIIESSIKNSSPKKQEIIRCLMAEAQINPVFSKLFYEQKIKPAEEILMIIFKRARDRGEISSSVSLDFLCDICMSYYWYITLTEKKYNAKELVSFIMNAIHTNTKK